MSVDNVDPETAPVPKALRIAVLAPDDLAARRIDGALVADRMVVATRWRSGGDADPPLAAIPDVLVVVFGRGVTARDQQMRRLRRHLPDVHIVAVMPEDSRRGIRRAVEAGANGVVFECDLETSLAVTIRAIVAGQIAVPATRRHDVDRPTLSSREKQVIGLVVSGKSNKAIAGELFLAESTVKCHLSSAFSKLGVRSRNEAADLVLQSGAELGFSMVLAPAAYATTEGSEHMTSTQTTQDLTGELA
ncbi:MAG TPA: response regulator transcription factor [Solirubrobacteraceae bacterium]|nr:response regulator transcription factor [Solirubrobacteraceae bacterium]